MSTKTILYRPTPQGAVKNLSTGDPWLQALESRRGTVTSRTAWNRQAWVRACVDLRARAVSSVPWTLTRAGSETDVWPSGEVVPDALAYIAGLPAILYLAEASMSLTGRWFTLKGEEAWRWINPETITNVRLGPEGRPAWYERQQPNSVPVWIPAEQMVADFRLDPFAETAWGQVSDGGVSTEAARVLMSMTGALHSFFDNGMIRATLLRVHELASDEEMTRVQRWWEKWLGGWQNTGRNKVIKSGGVEPITVGDGLKDMDNEPLTRGEREAICAAYRVPMFMLDSNAANFATAAEYRVEWYDSQILPACEQFAHAVNEQLLGEMGLELRLEPKRMEIYQAREIKKATSIAMLTGRPIMTVNEAREIMDLEPVPDGDELPRSMSEPEAVPMNPTPAKRFEADQWKRKIEGRGDRGVTFNPVHLSVPEADAIKARISAGWELEDVFSEPFTNY